MVVVVQRALLMVLLTVAVHTSALITDEVAAANWLDEYNTMAEHVYSEESHANWNYNTNLTDYNQQRVLEASAVTAQFQQEAYINASLFDWRNFNDSNIRRLFGKATDIGTAVLDQADHERVRDLSGRLDQADHERYTLLNSEMEKIYSTAKVCKEDNPTECLPLSPDLAEIMANSRDWEELKWAWQGWRVESGRKVKDMYEEFVTLQNKAAVENDYADTGAYWRSRYEDEAFEQKCLDLFNQLKPLYQQLHAYVKRKLKTVYSANSHEFPSSGQIPAHILGNMWSQTWSTLSDLLTPYPDYTPIDVTGALQEQGYTALRIFNVSEDFFTSLGLEPMPPAFWAHSMIEKPTDGREVVCHASAWDFYNRVDFRIKQCTQISQGWLETTHHEMGHIQYYLKYDHHHVEYRRGANPASLETTHHEMGHVQYYLQYKHLPMKYRRGGNPGFHEAVGDVLSLSVATPEHLQQIGLLDSISPDPQYDINFLMQQALDKIAFLPFGYLIDQWRWSVFKGETPPEKYNEKWWELRCLHQGISPPVERTAEDFDPGAKFHIPGNTPYIRYFVSFVIQFQFHKALCDETGYTGPLHRCDIYDNKAAGTLLGDMLSLGSSKPWPEAMEAITGQREMDASALLEYFSPLTTWLEEQNQGEVVTWDDECDGANSPGGANSLGGAPVVMLVLGLFAWIL